MIRCHLLHLILMAGVATTLGASSCDMALVREGDPVAVVVLSDDKTIPAAQRKAEQRAADVIVDWVEKITDARLKITRTVPAVRPAIFVGRAALDQGLSLTDIESPGSEGLKVVVDGQRALIAGQNPTSTNAWSVSPSFPSGSTTSRIWPNKGAWGSAWRPWPTGRSTAPTST